MVTASLKNYNFRLPMYEKLFVFSFMGGAVILTEFFLSFGYVSMLIGSGYDYFLK